MAILDGACSDTGTGLPLPVGNQIEYWAYYSSVGPRTGHASPTERQLQRRINALAIDSNPTTLNSVYSLGTYQQMYITGSTHRYR